MRVFIHSINDNSLYNLNLNFSMAGVTTGNVGYIAEAIHEVTRS